MKKIASVRSLRLALGAVASIAIGTPRVCAAACTAIASLPYTISAPGHYCLSGDLDHNSTTGSAIRINADDVDLDLQGHRIRGVPGTFGTSAYGIYEKKQNHVVIHDGSVRGFSQGVVLSSGGTAAGSAECTAERLIVEQSTYVGINVQGVRHIVRDNEIRDVGPQGNAHVGDGFGIYAVGTHLLILGNSIFNVTGTNYSPPTGVEIKGIALKGGSYALLEKNRIIGNRWYDAGSSSASQIAGVGISVEGDFFRPAIIDNRIVGYSLGVLFSTSQTSIPKCTGNLFQVLTNPPVSGNGSCT